MIIDFHTHTFPDHIADRAIHRIQSVTHSVAHTDGTVAGLTASMADAGIDLSVVLPVATNPEKLPSMNRKILESPRQGSLLYFGAIHPLAPDWREQMDLLSRAGVKGIKLHPYFQGLDINDPATLRVMDRAAELDLITLIHAGGEISHPGHARANPEMLAEALAGRRGAKVVLAHMGGWRHWDRVVQCLGPTDAYFDTALSLGSVMPLPGYSPELEQMQLMKDGQFCALVRALGAHRVLFGSDCPWGGQRIDLEHIRALPLTDGEKAALLHDNAAALLGL